MKKYNRDDQKGKRTGKTQGGKKHFGENSFFPSKQTKTNDSKPAVGKNDVERISKRVVLRNADESPNTSESKKENFGNGKGERKKVFVKSFNSAKDRDYTNFPPEREEDTENEKGGFKKKVFLEKQGAKFSPKEERSDRPFSERKVVTPKKEYSDRYQEKEEDTENEKGGFKKKVFLEKQGSKFSPKEERSNRPFSERKTVAPRKEYQDRYRDTTEEKPIYNDRKTPPPHSPKVNVKVLIKRKTQELPPKEEGEDTSVENESKKASNPNLMRLNKLLSNGGVASRRKADEHIQNGMVTVNGQVVREMGFHVDPKKDVVEFKGKVININDNKVYILLNKPKNHITTVSDELGRRTVMDLVKDACKERIYPVGRLDRNTTGVLLLTNDGELAEKLSHPSHKVSKSYYVRLDRKVRQEDMDAILAGIELEDGIARVDNVEYTIGGNGSEVGISLHIGKNRVVRRIFEHLGYQVENLDRMQYAFLTKKGLPRGKYRFLTQKEIIRLKYMTQVK